MAEEVTAVRVVETGASDFAVSIEVGLHAFIGDEPARNGGRDLGPSPYQLLTAALGECTAMTVRWFAKQHGWPLDRVAVEVTHRKRAPKDPTGKADFFEKRVSLSGDRLTREQRDRLIAVAGRCPVHRTLEGGAVIATAEADLMPGAAPA